MGPVVFVMVGLVLLSPAIAQAPEPARGDEAVPQMLRDAALRGDETFKYRIMVDKVYITLDGLTEEADYRRHAEMGFNVLCPRWIDKDLDVFEQAAALAARHGMYSMFWLRGSLSSGWGSPQFVHRNGVSYDILSPNSEELWQVLEDRILAAARLSQSLPVLGVFLDFEKYARQPGGFVGHCYPLSYDAKILGEFAEARNLTLPELQPDERAPWLEANDLHDAFREFQIDSWRTRVRAIREQVDRLNPRFQFAIYPSSFTLFVNEVVWTELGTEQAPLIAAEHYTYGRGTPLKDIWPDYWRVSDDEGVALDVAYIRKMQRKYAGRVPHAVIGGIDPVVPGGEDPQFVARDVAAMSKVGDGFWVFYEGVQADSRHGQRFEAWWKVANEAIETGTFEVLTSVRTWNPHVAEEFLPHGE
ncbi:MAG: hypothetical protein ACOX9R_08760 [Armatimonadota bacterium]|jgi:hypothetical protein